MLISQRNTTRRNQIRDWLLDTDIPLLRVLEMRDSLKDSFIRIPLCNAL
jgi:hypothetical protein